MKFPLILTFFFLVLTLFSLHSQEGWRQFTTQDGMSDDIVLSIHQSKAGDIWIGTPKGLDHFSGVFESYIHGDQVTHLDLFESSSGQLVAHMESGNNNKAYAVYLFDGMEWESPDFFRDNDIFVSEALNLSEFAAETLGKLWISGRDGLVGFDGQKWQLYDPDVDVNWLVKTPDGRLWSESWWADSIVSFDGQKWNMEFDTDNSPLDNAATSTVFSTSTGKIILGTDEGLFQYDSVLNSITDLELSQDNIKRIYESTEQVLWVGTDKGLFRLDNGKWQQVIDGQSINTIAQTKQGVLWVGTSRGLYQFHNGEWISELDVAVNAFIELKDGALLVGGNDGLRVKLPVDKSMSIQRQLPGELITGLFRSSDGTLWCRSTAGIFSYDGLQWTSYGYEETNPSGSWWQLSNIYEDKEGTIWFGEGNGLLSYKEDILREHVWSDSLIWTWGFLELADGTMWVMKEWGPYVYNGQDWTSLTGYGRDNLSNDNMSFGAYQNADGSIWVLGRDGMWLFDNGKWIEALDIESKPLGKTRNWDGSDSFIRGTDGTLWTATSKGLYHLNSTMVWEQSVDLIGDFVQNGGGFTQLHLTIDGTLIAIVVNEGLLTYNGKKWVEHLSYGSRNDGMQYNNHFGHGFVEYPQGVFWLATNKGIRRIQGDSWYDLTVADGLPSSDVRAVALDNSGNLWVGTTEGLARFTLPSNPNPPAVQLTQIDEGDIPDKRTYITGRPFVSIDWRGGDIETEPGRLQYQYNLDGQWSEITKQNTATIGLENGEHQFSVRVIDHHFNASSLESLTIIVKTEIPYLLIGNPANGDIVSGDFYVKGRVKDDDFAAFQVFLSDLALTETPVLEDDKEANLKKRTS